MDFKIFKIVFLSKYLKVFKTFTVFLENFAFSQSDYPADWKQKVLTFWKGAEFLPYYNQKWAWDTTGAKC